MLNEWKFSNINSKEYSKGNDSSFHLIEFKERADLEIEKTLQKIREIRIFVFKPRVSSFSRKSMSRVSGKRVGLNFSFKIIDRRTVRIRPKRVIDWKSNCGCLVGMIPEQQVLLRAMKSFLMKMRSKKKKKKSSDN